MSDSVPDTKIFTTETINVGRISCTSRHPLSSVFFHPVSMSFSFHSIHSLCPRPLIQLGDLVERSKPGH